MRLVLMMASLLIVSVLVFKGYSNVWVVKMMALSGDNRSLPLRRLMKLIS